VASYDLLVRSSAARELDALPAADLRRIVKRLSGLARNPRPPGCEKLSRLERYRIRQGDYRVLYEVDDTSRRVTIVRIGHRRDVYR
jgi:mRNA interferase RelE/StbE